MPDSNGNSQTDGDKPLGETLKPKVKQPDTSLNPNVDNVQVLSDNLPEFKGKNPYYIKKKLLDDNGLLEKTANQMFVSQFSDKQWEELQKKPEVLKRNFNLFKKNFRKDLVQSSYAGESPDKTLIKRSVEVSSSADAIPVSQYFATMQKHKKKYKNLGLLGDDGLPIYSDDEATFRQEIASNKQLHQKIEQDRYNDFLDSLGSSHNNTDAFDNPAQRAKAWIVYDKQGSEGLTKYVNALQAAQGGSITESFSERNQASQYLQSVRVDGKPLDQYYKEFVVGKVKDVKYGDSIAQTAYKHDIDPALLTGLVRQESNFKPDAISSTGAAGLTQLQPVTARENGLKVPDQLYKLDLKRIRSTGQQRKEYARELGRKTKELGVDPEKDERYDPQKALEATGNYLSKSEKKFGNDEDRVLASYHAGLRGTSSEDWKTSIPDSTKNYVDKVKGYKANYQSKVDRGLVFHPKEPREDIKKDFPKDLNGYTVNFYKKDGSVKKLKTSLPEFVGRYLGQKQAQKFNKNNFTKNGPYSDEYRQLIEGIYSNNDTKDLVNTLIANADGHGKYNDGTQYYNINYKDLSYPQKFAFDALQINPNSDELFRDMGDGKYQLVPDYKKLAEDIWGKARSYLYNTTTQKYKDKEGNIHFKEVPDKGWLAQIQNAAVNTLFAGASTATKYITTPLAKGLNYVVDNQTTRNLKDSQELLASTDLSGLSSSEQDGWLPNAAEEVAPMAWYLYGMMELGGAVTKGLGKAMGLASKIKAGLSASRAAEALAGSSRWAAIGESLMNTSNPIGKIYAGGATMESLTRDQNSFYNVLPELFGYDEKNAVSQYYNKANGWTKTAMDAVGSLAIDFGFDTLIAGSGFLKNKAAQKFFNKKDFQSFEYIPKVITEKNGAKKVIGTYATKDAPAFKHQFRSFLHELTDGLANKPIGNVGESMAKDLVGGDEVKTLHDAVKRWGDNVGGVANSIKKDIKENIRSLEQTHQSPVRLTEEQLTEIADSQYQNFVDTVGKRMGSLLKTSDDKELPLRFADALEQQIPTTKEFTVAGKKITPAQVDHYRKLGNKLVVKNGKVYEIDPKFWAVDIADSIRKEALDVKPEEVASRKLREMGIDEANPKDGEAQIINDVKTEADKVIGTPTQVDNEFGYVVDYNDKGYTVQTPQGKKQVSELKSPLPEKPSENIGAVSDQEFSHFVQTGKTTSERLQGIADKIIKGESPTKREFAIMNEYSDEMEQILRRRKNGAVNQMLDKEHTSKMVRKFKQYSEALDEISKSNGDQLKFCI